MPISTTMHHSKENSEKSGQSDFYICELKSFKFPHCDGLTLA